MNIILDLLSNFTVAGYVSSIPCFFLAFILYIYGKTPLHKIWMIFNIVLGFWGIGCILIGTSQSESEALFAWKFALIFGLIISPIFYHATTIFTKNKSKTLLILGYCIFIPGSLAHILFLGNINFAIIIPRFNDIYFPQASSLIYLSCDIFWIYLAIKGHIDLLKYSRNVDKKERNKALYFFFPMLIGFLGGSTIPIAIMGFNIFPYGIFSIPIYCAIVTYAFLKHNLLDINIIIKKSVIYSILLASASLLYLITILILEIFLKAIFHYNSVFVSILTAFFIGLLFVPIRNKIQIIIEKYIYKGSHEEIAEENILLKEEVAQKEKFKAVATLASGLAHEIKNPLTAINTFAEHLPQKKNDPEFLDKFSKIVTKESGRITDLIHQLLDFAKPSPLELSECSVDELIEDTLNLISGQIKENGIAVDKQLLNKGLLVKTDKNQLTQAFLNIILNAIDAMPSGGTLTINTRVIHLRDARSQLEISIKDTGSGIPSDKISQVFDPFFSQKDKGTGLGLSITQTIIENHSGKIKVTSQVGVGTDFIIELPILA